jgi:SAM-dependent methyltransferase
MRIRGAVFLITLSGLVFEIGLTRIYSATIWYHFAFVAISMALLGWGLGGLAVHLLKKAWPPSMEKAALFTLLYGLTIPGCLWILVRFPFELSRLPLYFVTPLVPFFLGGVALSMIFDLHKTGAGSLYFADLLGASLGAVSVTALLQLVGGEVSLLLASVAPLIASTFLARKLRIPAAALAAVMLVFALTNSSTQLFHVIPGTIKAMRRQMDENPGSRVAQSGWNAYSRIDAVEGVSPKFLARLYIDADAWTSIMPWDGRLDSVHEMRDSYRALPFHFNPGGETLIIGPGGGPDVVAALASGSRKVTAVEMNPLMIEFVRHYGDKAGSLYDRPDVEVIQSEGRNFISRTDRKFDTIFLGFVDSWASVASGGLSLSENYLYTRQAFKAYFDHLKDGGVLVILRWDSDIPRLVANSVALLGAEGASQRVAAILERRATAKDDPPQMLFMLRKRPFTAEESAQLEHWDLGRPLIVPGFPPPDFYKDLLSGKKTMAQWQAESPTLVGAVFDDSPFYFANERPWGMPKPIARRLFGWLLAPNVVLLALFAFFGKPKKKPATPYAAGVAYFACLGFGFISVELALLQNMTLLLGHPIFTLAILLFTLLAAGGFGSAVSTFVAPRGACLVIAALGTVEAIVLPRLVPLLLPLPIGARIAIAMLLVAPLGFVMGMPFPRGLQSTGRGSLPAPPFFWGLNGVMSVIGSVTTVFVALRWGFQMALLTGCLAYVFAGLASRTALSAEYNEREHASVL